MKVVGSKIALLVWNFIKDKCSLIVIRKGEHIWEKNTLACFPLPGMPTDMPPGMPLIRESDLSIAGDWISVTKWPSRRLTLWQDVTFRQDIDIPDQGCLSSRLLATAMDRPFLILSLRDYDKDCASIKVFRLAADNEMKDISTVASLVKSIPLGDAWPSRIICNQLFFGFVFNRAVTLIEKRALVDLAVPDPERRQIDLDVDGSFLNCVHMNSSSLVFVRDKRFVIKNDFWMLE